MLNDLAGQEKAVTIIRIQGIFNNALQQWAFNNGSTIPTAPLTCSSSLIQLYLLFATTFLS